MTFVNLDGETVATYTLDKRETLDASKIPTVQTKVGYDTKWSVEDFTNVSEDTTVTTVETAKTYTITYALANGETIEGGANTQTVVYDGNYQLKTPDKDLYTFDGWYNDTTLVEQSGVWKIASDVTLTAHWADNSYTVTFVNLDGTTVAHTLEKGEVLDASKIPTVQTKVGYATKWSVEDFTNISEDTTVETIATPETYTITYVLKEGETIDGKTGIITETVTYDSDYTLATPKNDVDAEFAYWAEADGTFRATTGKWTIANDVELHANWSGAIEITFKYLDGTEVVVDAITGTALDPEKIPVLPSVTGYNVSWSVTDFSTVMDTMTEITEVRTAKTYTITYSVPEDASMNGTTQEVIYNAAYELATPTYYGYKFDGWVIDDTILESGDKWQIDGNVTLTALWVDDFFVVTFVNTDGNSETVMVQNGDALSKVTTPELKPFTGYEVAWNVVDFSTITSEATITAVKKAKTYTITYSVDDDVTLDETSATVKYDSEYTLATPVRYGYKFAGWTLDGTPVAPDGTWKIDCETSDVTLTAVWEDNYFVVTFVNTDKTSETVKVQIGDALSDVKTPELKQVTGYTAAWNVEDFSTVKSEATITAVKTAKTYTITYSVDDDVTLDETSATVKYDSEYTLATPVRYGYIFRGWKMADGTPVESGDQWKIDGDVTLTAVWDDNYFVVTFVNTDGNSETVKVQNGDALSDVTTPELKQVTGYTVAWNVVDFSTITSETTITAVKTAKTYTITYKSAEGVTLPSEVTVTYGEEYNLGTPTNSDRGLYFAGWKNAETGEKVKTSGVWKVDDEDLTVTLEAIWIEVDSNDWTGNH